MEPTQRELAAHFAAMEDEVLLDTAVHRKELTEIAQDALLAELAVRRLTVPQAAMEPMEPGTPELLTDTSIITVRKFASLQEGMIARSALEAAGIDCFLRDEHTVTVATHLTNLLGGTKLDVREEDRSAAETVLLRHESNQMDEQALADIESLLGPAYLCRQCGSDDVNRVTPWNGFHTIASWVMGRRLPHGDQRWKCNHCKATWIDNERD